jgi:hypothetical protein
MQLRDYQHQIATDACRRLQQHNIAYLCMQVRTGKTATALQAADLFGARRVLFVTKLKALSSIVKDYHALRPSFLLNAINYESLHKVEGEHDLVIVDEAHCIGQYPTPSERTKALKLLCAGKPIIYLSGTPTPESYSQLFHQFYISSFSPFIEANFYKWAAEYVDKKVKYVYNRQLNDYSKARKEKIDAVTSHLFISFTQEEAGFKEDVQEVVLKVDMKTSTYQLAEKLRIKRVHITRDGGELIADTEVKLLNKLHQIFTGTVILENGEAVAFDDSKVRFIKERFEGQKIAIFYKFKAELGMLYWHFGTNNITSDPMVFADSDHLVFASQIQSGREGINLSTADALIFLNIDFAAVSYWQARARQQAKERIKACMMYWIFSNGGIEEKIYKAVQAKKDYTLGYFKKDYSISFSKVS